MAKLVDLHSIDEIIKEMSLEEKAKFIMGGSPFSTEPMPKYGIPSMRMLDSCNGLNSFEFAIEKAYNRLARESAEANKPLDREMNGSMGGLLIGAAEVQRTMALQAESGVKPAKKEIGCYPPGIALGASWNPEVVKACGHALAKELGSKGIDMILGPNVNIHRDPLCGRLAESYSEDPCLVGGLAPSMIKGIQEEGVVASVKHFAANNQEKDRMGVNEYIPERALREIYFPAFKECVDAGCKTVMSAYNKINGVPCAMNKWLLTDILRGEWGFEGFVVSDWGASYSITEAVAAGNDLTMPGPCGINGIVKAVEEGNLPEEKLDACIRNILGVILQSNAMTSIRPNFEMQQTIEAGEALVRESVVLLKNDGVLPLSTNTDVVFYGKRSKTFISSPAGSSAVETDLLTNPFDRTVQLLGAEHVAFEAPTDKTKYWIVTVGADGREGADRPHMEMDDDEKLALSTAIIEANKAGGKVIVIVNATGPIELMDYEDKVSAIVCPFFAGMQGGKVTADVIFGLVNPSGKLPLTWPKYYRDSPSYKNFPGENKEVWYGEGIYVGYRWYDARHIEPLYPFGYGMSYTSFELSALTVKDVTNVDEKSVELSLKVKNTGQLAGSEVIQIYVNHVNPKYDKPVKELKAFRKVSLKPGEEKTVELVLGKEDFASYYMPFGRWITEPGECTLLIGTSSREIKMNKRIHILCKDPFGLNEKSAIGKIVSDKRAVKIINDILNADIIKLADIAINYAPDKSWEEIWEGTAMRDFLKGKGLSKEEIVSINQKILAEFDNL